MKANSKDLRANAESAIMEELDWFNEGGITYEEVIVKIKRIVDSALSTMFHIGYERGVEDLKQTIFKPEV